MRDIVHEIDHGIAVNLKTKWDGRLPTWDEFKLASKSGRVRTNKGIASKTIFLQGSSKAHAILFGFVTASATFLVPVAAVVVYFVGYISGWFAAGSFLVGWYLYKVTLSGMCDGIRYGAEKNEAFYSFLIDKGAFLFDPP